MYKIITHIFTDTFTDSLYRFYVNMSKLDACVWKQGKMNERAGHYLCDQVYISSITQCVAKNNLSFHINYTANAIASLIMPNSQFRCFKSWLRKKAEINN